MRQFILPALLVAFAAMPSASRAAQSYDNCSGFIDSLPAIISTQGVWCLRADLSTAIGSGTAIAVDANNVTIDCNHFKIGGLAAGTASTANGIVSDRTNTTVRNCNVRGFLNGILIFSAGGNLVESNRLDGNLYRGIYIEGAGSLVRDNQVFDTGGSVNENSVAYGIVARFGVDVVGNTVYGVSAVAAVTTTYGIYASDNGSGTLRDNRIKDVIANGGGSARGIYTTNSDRDVVRGNDVQGNGAGPGIGIRCQTSQGSAFGNVISGFATPISTCTSSNNLVNAN